MRRRHAGAIHLLLTGVVMPHTSGRVLATTLGGISPETRIVFMSGNTDEAIGSHGVLDPGVRRIEKPFTIHTLAVKGREALDAPHGGTKVQ
ncbi:MAG TPA: hypothetical protein VML54_10575 [Candidatus Limnocylindrales bacterium]|nr:hypothetical protein [Candidatus Limnocylindrales bacterium]